MRNRSKDKKREHRITFEIVVDSYSEEERATAWHSYHEENLEFPFQAVCIKDRSGSPIRKGETTKVVAISDIDLCMHEMFVDIEWSGRILTVPLEQLVAVKSNKKTIEAIEDWHYWRRMGYEF
jgi:hypothetical protein